MKKFICVLASVVCMMLMSFTAFAAEGWNFDGENWQYLNRSDEAVVDCWKQSNGQWFYLDYDGKMAVDELIYWNDAYYYVDEKGAMVANCWKKLAMNEDEDERWMFFKSTGKAVNSGWEEINGLKYHFTDSQMDYGFLTDAGAMIEDDDYAWQSALYYCGSEDDGARFTGWLKVEDDDNEYVWIYFNPTNGKKVSGETKTINGFKYTFDSEGRMLTSFATTSTATSVYYREDGTMVRKGWFQDYLDEDADEKSWFYADNKGQLKKNTIEKINNHYYCFDSDGVAQTGLIMVNFDDKTPCATHHISSEDLEDLDAFEASVLSGCDCDQLMYFAESADNEYGVPECAVITGKKIIHTEAGDLTFLFNKKGVCEFKNGGVLTEKIENGFYYIAGILQNNDDEDAKYEAIVVNSKNYILNKKTGKVYTKGSYVDSDNEIKYIIKNDVVTIQHKVDGKWQ